MAAFHPARSPTLTGLLTRERAADDLDLLDDTRDGMRALRRAKAEQAVRLVGLAGTRRTGPQLCAGRHRRDRAPARDLLEVGRTPDRDR